MYHRSTCSHRSTRWGKTKQETNKHHKAISVTAFPVCPCRTLLSFLGPAPQPSHLPPVKCCAGKTTSQSPQKTPKREKEFRCTRQHLHQQRGSRCSQETKAHRARGLSSKWGNPTLSVCPGNVWHCNCDRSHAHWLQMPGAISITCVTGVFQVKSATPHTG